MEAEQVLIEFIKIYQSCNELIDTKFILSFYLKVPEVLEYLKSLNTPKSLTWLARCSKDDSQILEYAQLAIDLSNGTYKYAYEAYFDQIYKMCINKEIEPNNPLIDKAINYAQIYLDISSWSVDFIKHHSIYLTLRNLHLYKGKFKESIYYELKQNSSKWPYSFLGSKEYDNVTIADLEWVYNLEPELFSGPDVSVARRLVGELLATVKALKKENEELLYSPNGIEYAKAKLRFSNFMHNNNSN